MEPFGGRIFLGFSEASAKEPVRTGLRMSQKEAKNQKDYFLFYPAEWL
jgi:hypothetical protein